MSDAWKVDQKGLGSPMEFMNKEVITGRYKDSLSVLAPSGLTASDFSDFGFRQFETEAKSI